MPFFLDKLQFFQTKPNLISKSNLKYLRVSQINSYTGHFRIAAGLAIISNRTNVFYRRVRKKKKKTENSRQPNCIMRVQSIF